MKNRDKIKVTTSMTIDFDDLRDLIWKVCGDSYDIDDDYGQARFIRVDKAGEEIDDYDEVETERYVFSKLEEYFDVVICSFCIIDEYGMREVMIPYIDNTTGSDENA